MVEKLVLSEHRKSYLSAAYLLFALLPFAFSFIMYFGLGSLTGALVFFAIGSILALVLLPTNKLEISEEGFRTSKGVLGSPLTKWADVENFVAGEGKGDGVGYNKIDKRDAPAALRAVEKAGVGIFGAEYVLPDEYGYSPKELAELLSKWKASYSRQRS